MDASDPRIILFKIKALQAGYPPEAVDAFVNDKIKGTQIENLEADKKLEELQMTPEQRGETAAKEEIAKEMALQKAGIGEETKEDTEFNSVMNFIGELEKDYNLAGLGQKSGLAARGEGITTWLDILQGKDDPASRFKDNKEGFVATLKSITGDTGVLTEQDAKRLLKILPGLGSTKGEAEKWKAIKSQIAVKYGKDPKEVLGTKKPAAKEEVIPQEKVDSPMPQMESGNYSQAGAAAPLFEQARKLQKMAKSSTSEKERDELLSQARNLTKVAVTLSTKEAQDTKLGGVTEAAGNTQKFLGESGALPILGAILGRGINPTPTGSGVGAGVGEYLKQSAGQSSPDTLISVDGSQRRPNIQGLMPNRGKVWETAKTGVTTAATDALLTKILPGFLKPRATASAAKNKAAEEYTKKGVEFIVNRDMKDSAQYILGKRDYLEPAAKEILTKIANGKTLTPNEVVKMQPILREAGRTLTNNPLRSSEGQAFEYIYKQTVDQSKKLAPEMYKQTQNIAKTFATPTKDLDRGARMLRYGKKSVGRIAELGATGYLLNKLGILGGGGSTR